jgi:hypothetical protein
MHVNNFAILIARNSSAASGEDGEKRRAANSTFPQQ